MKVGARFIGHSFTAPNSYLYIEETMYLLRSPKNAQRLYKALEQLKEGKYQKRELIDD